MSEILEVVNVSKSFKDISVLKDVSLCLHSNEVISIIGPSGSGKSTLLRCICKLEEIDSGHIRYLGDNTNKNPIGMIFQHFNLFPHYSVSDNIIKPLVTVNKLSRNEAEIIAKKLLVEFRISEKWNSFPSQLSGGQKQRLAIARALALNPDILLFDEITSALDPNLRHDVYEILRNLKLTGKSMIIVTHDIEFAKMISDRFIFIENGIILEEGTPESILNSEKSLVKEFILKTM